LFHLKCSLERAYKHVDRNGGCRRREPELMYIGLRHTHTHINTHGEREKEEGGGGGETARLLVKKGHRRSCGTAASRDHAPFLLLLLLLCKCVCVCVVTGGALLCLLCVCVCV